MGSDAATPERNGPGARAAGPGIVVLWAVPRSVSTAFERTFAQHPAFRVVHEPFTNCYYFSAARRSERYGAQPRWHSYDGHAAVAAIRETAREGQTFVKDLCFQACDYVPDEFLAAVTNTFIMRHPSRVLASLTPLKPDFTEEEFGYTTLERLWQRVVDAGQQPALVDGDEFRRSPETVLRAYTAHVGVPFDRGMLEWEDGRLRDWGPDEAESQAKWHRTLENSHGILPPVEADVVVPPERLDMYERALGIYAAMLPFLLDTDPVPTTAIPVPSGG